MIYQVMNGMDATQAIRQSTDKQPYIILISGDSNIDHARFQDVGINGHLIKPIRMPDLKRELEKVSSSPRHSPG
jgi:CheY-like chemotaxis protein